MPEPVIPQNANGVPDTMGRPAVSCLLCAMLSAVFVAGITVQVLADDVQGTPGNVPGQQPSAGSTPAARTGFSYDPANGGATRTATSSGPSGGYAERIFNTGGKDFWRRARQGSEVDFPRFNDTVRLAAVYEVDLADSGFGRGGFGGRVGYRRRNFENLFVALQDPEDTTRFRALVGENTSVLSREDNLSFGNLTTVNRSLVLEEHNSIGIYGAQFGVQVLKQVTPVYTVLVAALDNRGSLNTEVPRYSVGNSLQAKLVANPINDDKAGRKLTWGVGFDNTNGIRNRSFTLLTAIGQSPLGGLPAKGEKLSSEADIAYTFPIFAHPATLEAEAIYSRFAKSRTAVSGGYVVGQVSVFDNERYGDLDPFLRYDLVSLGQDGSGKNATQRAIRAGVNYNLPYTKKLANLHLEYAHNSINGPAMNFGPGRSIDEFVVELRVSLQQYVRH